MDHQCSLDPNPKILIETINTGLFINLRRNWYKFCMISEEHPKTVIHYKSESALQKEEVRHLLLYSHMVHPFSKFSLFWEFFLYLNYWYLVVTHLQCSGHRFSDMPSSLSLFMFLGDLVILLDIVKFFFTGYYDEKSNLTIFQADKVAKHYLKTFFFLDVASSLSSYLFPLTWFYGHKAVIPTLWGVVRILAFLKLFRVKRWLSALELFREYYKLSSFVIKILKTVSLYAILLVWLYSCFFYVNKFALQDKTTSFDMEFFYATLVLLVVSYEYEPQSFVETGIIIFFLLIGYVLFLFLLAHIMQTWNKLKNASNKNQHLLEQYKKYMVYKRLPVYMRQKIIMYFNFKYQHEFYNETQINRMLSDILKLEILMHVWKELIESVEFLKNVPEKFVKHLVTLLKSEIYLPGDVVVAAGTLGNCMYFVHSGTLATYTSTGTEVCHLEDGAYFGETTLIFGEQRVTSVVAISACELVELKQRDFLRALRPYPDIKEHIKNYLINKIRESREFVQ